MKIAVVSRTHHGAAAECIALARANPTNEYWPLGMLESVCGRRFDKLLLLDIEIMPGEALPFLNKLENLVWRLPIPPASEQPRKQTYIGRLADEAENAHKCLDMNAVPKTLGTHKLTLWGRVLALLSKPKPLDIERTGEYVKCLIVWPEPRDGATRWVIDDTPAPDAIAGAGQ